MPRWRGFEGRDGSGENDRIAYLNSIADPRIRALRRSKDHAVCRQPPMDLSSIQLVDQEL
jgi:hypothetical protein